SLDEVRIWSILRSEAEIAAHYNRRLMGTEAGLLGYWRFDRLEDLNINTDGRDDIRDLSPTGAHLDLVNGPVLEPLINLTSIGDMLYFPMDDNRMGVGPWKSDGTAPGTGPIVAEAAGKPTLNPKIYTAAHSSANPDEGVFYHTSAGHDDDFEPLMPAGGSLLYMADSLAESPDGFLYVNQDVPGTGRRIDRYDPDTGEFVDTIVGAPAEGQAGHFKDGGIVVGLDTYLYIGAGSKIIRYDRDTRSYLDNFVTGTGSEDFRGMTFSSVNGNLFACDAGSAMVREFSGANGSEVSHVSFPVWEGRDIGATQKTGSVSLNNGAVTIQAAGNDIWDNTDQFHYYYVKLTGDGVIQARVDSLQDVGANGYQKAAVMIRESLAPDSRHAMMAALSNGYCSLQYRSTSSGASNWHFNPD
ncbi:MAG TPA: hypothetical protein PLB62_16545, partial [Candidatus Sumerlaeota bacterium]|nr:hypothetical protein [Candidatus Sumerlaeota bacterium]